MSTQKMSCLLVGGGKMGSQQAGILASHPDFLLAGICDLNFEQAQRLAAQYNVPAFGDLERAIDTRKPDTVAICTGNSSHAPICIQTAEAGVKGVYCEKPMAVNLADAQAMVEVCRQQNVALVINHQRRIQPDLRMMKTLMDKGAIGETQLIRGNCSGDILSDGTHLVDSLLFLCGDAEAEWITGQIHRSEGKVRYGHPIEDGGAGIFNLKTGEASIRCEIFCGELRDGYRTYHDLEVFGTAGRLWRAGDLARPNVYIQNAQGGDFIAGLDENWHFRPLPAKDDSGIWRPVEIPDQNKGNSGIDDAITRGYAKFAEMIRNNKPHPMCGRNALRGFEIMMSIYESARLNRKIQLPLEQKRFPLEIMAEGENT